MLDSKNQTTKQITSKNQTQIPITPIQDLSFCIISTEVIEIPPKSKEIYCFCCL